MGKCGSVIDAAQETLVLAFQVADATLLEAPGAVQRILTDAKIKKAIETAALAQARELVQKQRGGKPVSSQDVTEGLEKVATAAGSAAKTVAQSELEKTAKSTAEYKKLEQSLKELECAWKKSPMGVFVDKHKGLLIIVGSGLALQGAIAMYHFKAGDEIAGPATDLAKKLVKFTVLGNIEISAKEITFKPSERLVGTTMLATGTWKRVTVKFEAGITFQDTDVAKASVGADVSVKVVKDLTLTGKAGYKYQAPSLTGPPQNAHQYDLGLGFSYSNAFGASKLSISAMMFGTQDPTKTTMGGKAAAKLNLVEGTKKHPTTLDIELGGGANHILRELPPPGGTPTGPQTDWRATLGIVGRF